MHYKCTTMHYMKLIPKSFRFTEQDQSKINAIKSSISCSKDIEVIRYAIDALYNQRVEGTIPKPIEVNVVHGALQIPKCPYEGWIIMPNPLGTIGPYFSEYHECKMLEISNPKPPFQKVVLKEGSEWYDYFINKI